jgi:hypothetical protein
MHILLHRQHALSPWLEPQGVHVVGVECFLRETQKRMKLSSIQVLLFLLTSTVHLCRRLPVAIYVVCAAATLKRHAQQQSLGAALSMIHHHHPIKP